MFQRELWEFSHLSLGFSNALDLYQVSDKNELHKIVLVRLIRFEYK